MTTILQNLKLGSTCGYSAEDKAAIAALRRKLAVALTMFLGMVALQSVVGRHGSTPLQMTVAIASGIGFSSILVLSWLVILRQGDEYRRMLLSKALATGVGATIVLASIYGYIEIAWSAAPRIPMLALPVLLVFLTATAKLIVFRREQPFIDDPAA